MSLEQSRLLNGVEETRKSAASRIASKESREKARHSFASYSTQEEDLTDVYTDMDEPCVIEEATVMDAKEVTIETPKLPEKSALRMSRFLDSLKRNSITESLSDPHDVYLSSEEDASSSADDFSDYDSDSDLNSNGSEKSHQRRVSHEESARAVSVIFVGRPCVVDLASGRRSVSPIRRPQSMIPSSLRQDLFADRPEHPPRKSSLASTIDITKENPSFLSQDPFATNNYRMESLSRGPPPASISPRPKTPTAAFHRFQKSLSLVRKRSRPNLKDAASRDSLSWPLGSGSGSASTTDLLSLNSSRTSEEEQQLPRRPRVVSAATMPPEVSVITRDSIRSSRRDSLPRLLTKQPPQPASPSPPSAKRGLLSGLNMNRRRSLRIKP
ncbi:uncharacterized protein GGS22DRAFT_168175 [Annulohypoxylon maeteangense]|uniref:uncharacterized protein n=1 Tax=Annulohypoxylon maeteangense TaxID=1927788 RepID=UPI00200804D2|nr:uncharacterized protein GGS22DRAFT_168175 [Annulohypoxylon maeteangense]KAI0883221.1 hypothetical protein GGS22DRAFT_168175 [Annulohypoxylon maeteangense]